MPVALPAWIFGTAVARHGKNTRQAVPAEFKRPNSFESPAVTNTFCC